MSSSTSPPEVAFYRRLWDALGAMQGQLNRLVRDVAGDPADLDLCARLRAAELELDEASRLMAQRLANLHPPAPRSSSNSRPEAGANRKGER